MDLTFLYILCQPHLFMFFLIRYKHLRKDRADLPMVADFTLGLSQMQAGGKEGAPPRRPAPKPNEFYKISLCKHFLQGECPFGEGCHFAHGEHELRSFPRQEKQDDGNDVELSDNMFADQDNTTIDYFQGGASGGGKPNPILEPEHAYFFIIRAATYHDLAISTSKSIWYIQRKHATQLNNAYQNGKKQVMIFFMVSDSHHIQGAALMTSTATYQEGIGNHENDSEAFCYKLKVEWYRTTELPINIALAAAPDLLLPTQETSLCQDMSSKTGEALMKAVWNSPLVTLYESWSGDQEPPAPEELLTDFRAPGPDEIAWPTMPGPGKLA